jgi:GxxExxY protein
MYCNLELNTLLCRLNLTITQGPGLLESVYSVCLFEVLREEGLFVDREVILPVVFKGKTLDKNFIIDLLVERKIIVELKAVETIMPVHEA